MRTRTRARARAQFVDPMFEGIDAARTLFMGAISSLTLAVERGALCMDSTARDMISDIDEGDRVLAKRFKWWDEDEEEEAATAPVAATVPVAATDGD